MCLKNHWEKLILTSAAILVLACSSMFSNGYFNYSDVQIESSTDTSLILTYKPAFAGIDTMTGDDGSKFLLPRFANSQTIRGTIGSPMKVIRKITVTVPSPDGFKLENYSVSHFKRLDGKIAPTPEMINEKGIPVEKYSLNNTYYQNYTTSNSASIRYTGLSRTRYIADLDITVAEYDSKSGQIVIPGEVSIEISFTPKENKNIFFNDNFDIAATINHNETSGWRVQNNPPVMNETKNNTDEIQSLSSGTWLKISIESEGMYLIDAIVLSALGYSISPGDIATIKIFGNGGKNLPEKVSHAKENVMNEQPVIIRTNGDGSLGSIIFYAASNSGFHYDDYSGFRNYLNSYSRKNYYLMTWGGSKGKRAEAQPSPSGQVENTPDKYTERYCYREEVKNPFSYGSGRFWFGGSVFPRSFSAALPNLDRNGEVVYRFNLAHTSAESSGEFSINESQNHLGKINISSTSGDYTEAIGIESKIKMPASLISSDNRSYINISYSNSKISKATPYFNFFEIHYPRYFVPVDNQIGFFTNSVLKGITEYNINGFSGEIFGWDVTKPGSPQFLQNESSTGGLYIFKIKQDSGESPRRFFISSILKQPVIEKTEFGYYRDNPANADLIIITHPDLLASAEAYRQYRTVHDNISASIFRTDLIYNEFNAGTPDPTAIRDFIAYAFNNWSNKPKYVLLWGNGHFDYKNIQTQTISYVPTYESLEEAGAFSSTGSFATDDYFAKITGDDNIVDIALGRLPVESPEVAVWMLEKIKKYENSSSLDSWRTNASLLADDSQAGKSYNRDEHTAASESISRNISDDFIQKKIYLVEYPTENTGGGRRKPRAQADFLSAVNNSGSMLVCWVGHGNPRVWAHEEVFDRDKTIPTFRNMSKLFFATSATCDFGRFDMADIKCGSEELVVSKFGGAIGTFSATRAVYTSGNAAIASGFYNNLFQRDPKTQLYPRLGDVLFKVKQYFGDDNSWRYNLLGDPSMKLLIPDYIVTLDSINGTSINEQDTINIKAHSLLSVSGSVINPLTKATETSFNGKILINVMDCDLSYFARDEDSSIHNITKQGGALNRGITEVRNGKFSIDIIVPEDISYLKGEGRIQTYSYSDDNRFAKGVERALQFRGFDSALSVESSSPQIQIFLDSVSFQPGDIVSKKPLLILHLQDQWGINTTGNGIGHRIEAWFDDNPNSLDLTDDYVPSFEIKNSGTVRQYIYDLQPGYHKVKVRAWNVFNKYSISETYFRIMPDNDGAVITDLINYPNPFSNGTTIRFDHNLSKAFTAEADIFTINGGLVRSLSAELYSVHTSEIYWDCRDAFGNHLSTGTYIYSLKLRTNDGITGAKSGIMVLVR